jgi:hypothetical protein
MARMASEPVGKQEMTLLKSTNSANRAPATPVGAICNRDGDDHEFLRSPIAAASRSHRRVGAICNRDGNDN